MQDDKHYRVDRERLFSVDGRVALVTGSSGGLGLAMAAALASAGAHVLINGRYGETVNPLVAQFTKEGLSASPMAFDVTDDKAREAAIARIEEQFGRIDILVNNAAIRHRAPVEEMTVADYTRMLESHLISAFALSRLAAPIMRRNKFGRIINLTSVSAILGRAGDAAYISAKGGISALTRALACEFGSWGITVNAICPGLFITEVNKDLMSVERHRRNVEERTPLRRPAEPHELGGAAIFLSSEAGSYVTGHVLAVDGGMSIAI